MVEAIEEKKSGKKSEKANNPEIPRSGNKLVHFKKELASLKKMKESLGSYTINEGGDNGFVAEYAHMQKFVNELEKLKEAHARLSEMIDGQISEVEGRVTSETQKIKEMMGLIEKEPTKKSTGKKPVTGKKEKEIDESVPDNIAGNPKKEKEMRDAGKGFKRPTTTPSKPTAKPEDKKKPVAKK